jgi:hypothetical protein
MFASRSNSERVRPPFLSTGATCKVIESEATEDRLWEPLYEQFGQMDKYSSRTQSRNSDSQIKHVFYFILQLLYDVMDIPFEGPGFCDGE